VGVVGWVGLQCELHESNTGVLLQESKFCV
jgi:hypothetical protein